MDTSEKEVPPEVREEVASAVRSAIAKNGYADLTTSQIAKETEKSEAFLFYHYDTKDDLVTALLEDSVGWLDVRLKLTTEEPETPDERLRTMCEVLLALDTIETMQGLHVGFMELLSTATHNETVQEPLERHQNYVRNRLADEIRAGIEKGTYRQNIDPEASASFLQMTLDGSTGSVLALGMEEVGTEIRDEIHTYIDGLMRERE